MSYRPEERRYRSKATSPQDERSPSQKDFDRILYSSALQRLANVTQVVGPEHGVLVSNRLTHSIKVACLSKRIADAVKNKAEREKVDLTHVGGIDPDAAAAAGLAHDLGHPPFGHIGERKLNDLLRKHADEEDRNFDGFEGNAQSFRILNWLAFKDEDCRGLDLTRRTMNAVLKYPWRKSSTRSDYEYHKFGYYTDTDDAECFKWAQEGLPSPGQRTLEAQIMDWADEVAYAVYDYADFYRAGLIPSDRLFQKEQTRESKEFIEFLESQHYSRSKIEGELFHRFLMIYERMKFGGMLSLPPFREGRISRAKLRGATGSLLDRYAISPLSIKSNGNGTLVIDEDYKIEVFILKKINEFYVIRSAKLLTLQEGQKRILEELFNGIFTVCCGDKVDFSVVRSIMHEHYATDIERLPSIGAKRRVICDFVSGLSEEEVYRLHSAIHNGRGRVF